jgi:hypothetical protein
VEARPPSRERADEIIYDKSTGVPIQDLVTAQAVERRATLRNIGTEIEIGGDQPRHAHRCLLGCPLWRARECLDP